MGKRPGELIGDIEFLETVRVSSVCRIDDAIFRSDGDTVGGCPSRDHYSASDIEMMGRTSVAGFRWTR